MWGRTRESGSPRAWLESPARFRPPSLLPAALEANAAADAPYLVFRRGDTRHELRAKHALAGARRVGAALIAAGVQPGDRVPILLPSSPDFVHAFFGAHLAGAVPVPLPTPLTFGRLDRYVARLGKVVLDAAAHVIVATGRYAKAASEDPQLSARIRACIDPCSLPKARAPVRWPSLSGDALALLQYTSGTSGEPKGVEVTHSALAANTLAIADALDIGPSDVGVSWLPVFHDMGLIGAIATPVTRPFPVHVLPPEAFIMRPKRWLKTLSDVGATLSPAPNFAYELCRARVRDLDGIHLEGWRAALSGAEMVHPSTLDRFDERFAPAGFSSRSFMPVYGLAESTLAVTARPPGEGARKVSFDGPALERGQAVAVRSGPGTRSLASVGSPVGGAEVRVVREGRVAIEGIVGEIQTRGPSLMRGYFRRPAATEEVLADGWLRTGDLGFVHGGELFIQGRIKDLIVQSGRNVSPDEVERIALEEADVRGGAAAFGVVDAARGTEALVLVVEVVERDDERRVALAKRLRGRVLGALSVGVDEVVLWPLGAIPRTTSGKIQRAACRARWGDLE